jgi:hypothetical protein
MQWKADWNCFAKCEQGTQGSGTGRFCYAWWSANYYVILKLPVEQLWIIEKNHKKFAWLILFYLWCFLTAVGVVFNYCKLKLKVERKNFLTNAFKAWCSKSHGTFRKHLKLSKQKKKKNLCVKVADTFFFCKCPRWYFAWIFQMMYNTLSPYVTKLCKIYKHTFFLVTIYLTHLIL